MEIIPVINVADKKEFEKKLSAIKAFLPLGDAIHVDIAQKPFASIETYGGEEIVSNVKEYEWEAHYMGENLGKAGKAASSFKKVFLHCGWWKEDEKAPFLNSYTSKIGIAFSLNDRKEKIIIPEGITHTLFLGVHPGKAGQKFNEASLDMILFLKTKYPNVTLTYDGGVGGGNILQIRDAGADRVVVSSAIWNSDNPALAYKHLNEAISS